MPSISDIAEFKVRVDKLRRDVDRAQGAVEQSMSRLRSEFDCNSVKAAEKKLAELEAKLDEQEEALAKEVNRLRKEYPHVFD